MGERRQTPMLTRRRFLRSAVGAAAASALPWPARAGDPFVARAADPFVARAADPFVARAADPFVARAADPFVELDATAQAALVRRGEVTPLELVDAAIARIEALDPQLNAFVTTCFERAREQARGPLPDGPLRGVPYAIKDLSDYEGVRTTFGSRLLASYVASNSNGIVQRALTAGLVILGKTNTPEFGLISTTEPILNGPSRNPWSLAHHTGGSSGGAAAAVASGMLPCAQASDGGGSIRIPASCCGLFGLKPSRGRIFATRAVLPGDIAVRFAVSRSVRDSATLLAASERSDARAPLPPVGAVTGPSSRRLRIGFQLADLRGRKPDPEVASALEQTAALCAELGHMLVEAAPPIDADEFQEHFFAIWASTPDWLAARAWLIGLTQLRFVRAADVLEPWTLGLADWLDARGGDAVERAVDYCARLTRDFDAFFADVDVLLTPVLSAPPVELGVQGPEVPFDELFERVTDYVGYTPQHNAAGTPSMSVPLSMSAAGLPIGSQFAARVGGERTLLELAYELEQARPWSGRRPPHWAGEPRPG